MSEVSLRIEEFRCPPPPIPIPPLPAVPPSPPARRSVAAIVVGAVLLVAGFLTAASGAALLAVFSSDGKVTSEQHMLSTPTTALVADLGEIRAAADLGEVSGPPTLHVTTDSGEGTPVFVGIARTEDVERYLRTCRTTGSSTSSSRPSS